MAQLWQTLMSIWAWFVLGTALVLWLPVMGLIRLATLSDPGRYAVGYVFRRIGPVMATLNPLWRFRTSGTPPADPRRPYVVVSNHESFADILLISHLPWEMKWLSKAELFRVPVLGWLMRLAGDIPVRVGDRVKTDTALTTVDKPGSLEAYIYVPIERSTQLRRNLPVQILDSDGKVVADSRVSFISPQVDNTTQSVLVKSVIANNRDKMRTSQFIRARVIWDTRNSPVVPVLAVTRIGDQYFAFIAEPQKDGGFVAHQRPLKVGQMVGNDYAVLEGIKPGERVIVSGTQFLVDGTPVVPQS